MPKKVIDVEAGTVTFNFEDETSTEFNLNMVSEDILRRLALHGASQKIGDSYAGAGDADDPLAYAKQSVHDVIEQLAAGDWRVTAVGGPRVTDLATVLSQISGKSIEECVAVLGDATDEQKKTMRALPRVKAGLAAIAAARAAEKAEKLSGATGGEGTIAKLFS